MIPITQFLKRMILILTEGRMHADRYLLRPLRRIRFHLPQIPFPRLNNPRIKLHMPIR